MVVDEVMPFNAEEQRAALEHGMVCPAVSVKRLVGMLEKRFGDADAFL